MIPGHIKDELSKLSPSQQLKFHELLSWAGNSGLQATGNLPVDYYKLLDMVKRMGGAPMEPIAPIIHDDPEFTFKDYLKDPQKE
jgi:hypothetical protein